MTYRPIVLQKGDKFMSNRKIELLKNYAYLTEAINIIMADCGWSNSEMARKMSVSVKTIERARTTGIISMDTLLLFNHATKANYNFLLGNSINPFPYIVRNPTEFRKKINYLSHTFNNLSSQLCQTNFVADFTTNMDLLVKALDINPYDDFNVILEKYNNWSNRNLSALMLYINHFYNI